MELFKYKFNKISEEFKTKLLIDIAYNKVNWTDAAQIFVVEGASKEEWAEFIEPYNSK